MKKEINSKSKRKWVAGGLAAFASIALLTTGFATWVVGQQQTVTEEEVTVEVDTAKNTGISFEMTLSDATLELKEKNVSGQSIVNISGNDSITDNNVPLQITATYKIVWGKAYEQEHSTDMFTKISFSILDASGAYVDNKVASDANKTGRESGEYTYFDLDTTMIDLSTKISNAQSAAGDGTRTINVTLAETIQFKWGNYFGNDNTPASYYNAKYPTPTMDDVTNVYDELSLMKTALNGKKIKLHAELAR